MIACRLRARGLEWISKLGGDLEDALPRLCRDAWLIVQYERDCGNRDSAGSCNVTNPDFLSHLAPLLFLSIFSKIFSDDGHYFSILPDFVKLFSCKLLKMMRFPTNFQKTVDMWEKILYNVFKDWERSQN
jgi:hypothetical protein